MHCQEAQYRIHHIRKDMLAELDFIDQPATSISEIRTTTNKGHATPHLETLCKSAEDNAEYQQLQHFILDGVS